MWATQLLFLSGQTILTTGWREFPLRLLYWVCLSWESFLRPWFRMLLAWTSRRLRWWSRCYPCPSTGWTADNRLCRGDWRWPWFEGRSLWGHCSSFLPCSTFWSALGHYQFHWSFLSEFWERCACSLWARRRRGPGCWWSLNGRLTFLLSFRWPLHREVCCPSGIEFLFFPCSCFF